MFNTISARQLQREYKKVLEEANKTKQSFIVMSNNKPQGVIGGLDLLERMRLDALYDEGMADYKAGRTTTIKTDKEFKAFLKEIEEMAKWQNDKNHIS